MLVEIDLIVVFVDLVIGVGWVCFIVDDSCVFVIEGGCYFVVECVLCCKGEVFVVNDCVLIEVVILVIWLLIGLNMVGKLIFLC